MNERLVHSGYSKSTAEYDAIIVGAGIGGLYQLYRMREAGLSVLVMEAGSDVGGTWFWNRYPGARVDVESMQYSYSFSDELANEWQWTERYATQPELLKYINHVADRFDLRPNIQCKTSVASAHFVDDIGRWMVETESGERFSAQFVIMATGCLSKRKAPDFKGLDSFQGEWFMTSDWPKEGVDFSGKRVGLIGTGSTGVQLTPRLAAEAKHLTIFQRTANYSLPACNGPIDEEYQLATKQDYRAFRERAKTSFSAIAGMAATRRADEFAPEERDRELQRLWDMGGFALTYAFTDVGTNKVANDYVSDFVRRKIRETVKDPVTAELLCPNDHAIGTKRACVDTGYYETFNNDNVSLVSIRESPITEITPNGLRTTAKDYELDVIIFAIGFDAMTGSLLAIDIRGRGGKLLRDVWQDGPETYLGLAVSGFPNLFTITGPQSPSVLVQMMCGVEHHVDWIMDCIAYMRDRDFDIIEATLEAQEQWVQHSIEVGKGTLCVDAASWYTGANVEGKPRIFMPYLGGFPAYREKCEDVAACDYRGFAFFAAKSINDISSDCAIISR